MQSIPETAETGRESSASPTLSVVLSFYNEEKNIPELLRRLRTVLGSELALGHLRSYELIFVNDASTDRSEQLLIDAAKDGDIRLISMSRNFGHAACLMAGLHNTTGDLIVYLDADIQDPPEIIPDMIAAWRDNENIDVVNTQRLSRAGESKFKLWLTGIGYHILEKTTDIKFLRDAGDFKLITRRVLNHMLELKESLPFFRGLIYWIGFKQITVPYHREMRFSGKSKMNVVGLRVIKFFLFYALVSFSTTPLLLSISVGLGVLGLDLLIILHALIAYFFFGGVPTGWTSLIILISFMGGVQLLSIGVIGLYINSIFIETKRRPLYIVASKVGFPSG